MAEVDWAYASEKLSQAVDAMMLPHRSEAWSIKWAGHFVHRGFQDVEELDHAHANEWLQTIRRLLDTSGIDPSTEEAQRRGTLELRAEQLSYDDKHELQRCLSELHAHAQRKYWYEEGRKDGLRSSGE